MCLFPSSVTFKINKTSQFTLTDRQVQLLSPLISRNQMGYVTHFECYEYSWESIVYIVSLAQ